MYRGAQRLRVVHLTPDSSRAGATHLGRGYCDNNRGGQTGQLHGIPGTIFVSLVHGEREHSLWPSYAGILGRSANRSPTITLKSPASANSPIPIPINCPGMKQQASVARAFTNDPAILLLDEPFGSLDEQTRVLLQQELLKIWEDSKRQPCSSPIALTKRWD